MDERVKRIVAEFRPALGWILGAVFGLIILLTGSFLFGLIIMLGCAYMTKIKIGQGVAANAVGISKEVFEFSKKRIGDALASKNAPTDIGAAISEPEPEKAAAWFHIATMEWDTENYERCLEFAEMATNANPSLSEAWHLTGRAHDKLFHAIVESASQQRHGEAAIEAFKRTVELDPQNAYAHCQLGYFYHFFDLNRAREHYQIAASINSDFQPALEEINERIEKTDFVIGEIKLIMLPSMRTEPTQKILKTRFSFGMEVGCAVIHTCVNGSSSKTFGGWFFKEETPDLFRDRPIKSFQIWDGFSDSRFSSSVEIPSNFEFVRNHLVKENYL